MYWMLFVPMGILKIGQRIPICIFLFPMLAVAAGKVQFHFTILDLSSAFWKVPLRRKDREKTGFACELGLYQWKRMPFGLRNAMATFQRLTAQALTIITKKYGNFVMCYVDGVVIATPALVDHIDSLDEVFVCKKRADLKCKPCKC